MLDQKEINRRCRRRQRRIHAREKGESGRRPRGSRSKWRSHRGGSGRL